MLELLGVEPLTLQQFLTSWYGPLDRPAKAFDGVGPGPVREWFEVTSRWSRPVAGQNRVMGDPPGVVEDGKLLVWTENQGVWVWGVDIGVEDPEVYDRMNRPGEVWRQLCHR